MSFIILDRDGVINYDSKEYIKSPDEWVAIPGSLEAIADLNRAGFRIVLATNQSGLARGFFNQATLDEIHEKLTRELASVGGYIEEIFYCPHHPSDQCQCRKPRPGMLYQIQQKYQIDLAATYFIGDNLTDIQAARAAGCQPLFVRTGLVAQALINHHELSSVPQFDNLSAAVRFLLHEKKL